MSRPLGALLDRIEAALASLPDEAALLADLRAYRAAISAPRALRGQAGGLARAASLTPARMSEIGRQAAAARWHGGAMRWGVWLMPTHPGVPPSVGRWDMRPGAAVRRFASAREAEVRAAEVNKIYAEAGVLWRAEAREFDPA